MRILSAGWRFLVGLKDLLALVFFLLFFGAIFVALSVRPQDERLGEGALLIRLTGPIVEEVTRPTLSEMAFGFLGSSGPEHAYRERDIIQALDAAAKDGRVKAVVLDLEGFAGGGQVTLGTVGEAIARVRAKKPVLAYATYYSDEAYSLAANASDIWLNPMGALYIAGPGGSRLYYKGLLDRLGIETHVYRVGTFKSAVEPFIRADQSPEARQANEALAQALWQQWLARVAKARPAARVQAYAMNPAAAAQGTNFAQAAANAGLVDHIGAREDFETRVAQIAGRGHDPKTLYARMDFAPWLAANPLSATGKVGVITVAGEIIDGESEPGSAGGDTIVALVNQALASEQIRALVLRVDSPGGSAVASEQMRTALLRARARKIPVIVSMGNVAASGGYWISTAGTRIFAEPDTITGSIGVFGILRTFKTTLAKLGVTVDGVQTTPLSGQPDLIGGINPETDALLQHGVEVTYRQFLDLVAGARRMTPQRVDQIAQGRVWAGGDARQLGLVDQFGTLPDAVAAAAAAAGLSGADAHPVWIEPTPSFVERLVADFTEGEARTGAMSSADPFTFVAQRRARVVEGALTDVQQMVARPSIQARCLECLSLGGAPAARAAAAVRVGVPSRSADSQGAGSSENGLGAWMLAIGRLFAS